MPRTHIVIDGFPEGRGGTAVGAPPSAVRSLSLAEDAEYDKLDAIHPHLLAFRVQANSRIAALVSGWNIEKALLNEKLGLDDTLAKQKAVKIALFATRRVEKKYRALPTVGAISAVDPVAADPFGDGQGWPT